MKAFGEPGRIEKGLINAHRVHILEPSLRIASPRAHRMSHARIEFTDIPPAEAGAPDRMARDVRIHRVAKHLAIDLEVTAPLPLLPPQRIPPKCAIFRLEVFGP